MKYMKYMKYKYIIKVSFCLLILILILTLLKKFLIYIPNINNKMFGLYFDTHDHNTKLISNNSNTGGFIITPCSPNQGEWKINISKPVNRTSKINFNVPGKPNPPPKSWGDVTGFFTPTGQLVFSHNDKYLNTWQRIGNNC
jgi:hypothetical protein